MIYGLLVWTAPHTQESFVHPEQANVAPPESTHRLADLWHTLTKRVFHPH